LSIVAPPRQDMYPNVSVCGRIYSFEFFILAQHALDSGHGITPHKNYAFIRTGTNGWRARRGRRMI
jgi:hypothetical protein